MTITIRHACNTITTCAIADQCVPRLLAEWATFGDPRAMISKDGGATWQRNEK